MAKDQHEYAPTQTDSAICWPSKRWSSNAPRPEQKGSHNAQENYERYLALAKLKPKAAT